MFGRRVFISVVFFWTCFTACSCIRELLTFSDLEGLGTSPGSVYYKCRCIVSPWCNYASGFSLNNWYYGSRCITYDYGMRTYKELGRLEITHEETTSPERVVLGSTTAINRGSSRATVAVSVTGKWGEVKGWKTSITKGLSFSAEFGIEGIFKTGIAFSYSATSEDSYSKSTEESETHTVTVDVPPHSKKHVSMVAVMKTSNLYFKRTISVSGGWFGLNYPYRINGHYFWFVSSNAVLPKTSGEITGVVHDTKAFESTIEIDDLAQALEDNE